MKLVLTIISSLICCSSSFGQTPNFPVGNPTGTAGTGNAITDSDNFFMRNNIAGLTEIPLNEEEEITRVKTKANKGSWRFNGELQLLAFRFLDRPSFNSDVVANGTTLTPNFAGEITYTSSDHRFGFGIGTYQIINFNYRALTPSEIPPFDQNVQESRYVNTDIVVAGALRVHKKLSVGLGIIFSRGSLNDIFGFRSSQRDPEFLLLETSVDGVGATRANIGIHYRPTNFLSLGINYRSRRKYTLLGERTNLSDGKLINRSPARIKLSVPSMLEAGIEVKPYRKLLLSCDFRYYDYSVGQPLEGFAADIQSFFGGLKYSLTDRTTAMFGVTTSCANGRDGCFRSFGAIGTGISGGVGYRFRSNRSLSLAFTAFPGTTPKGTFDRNLGLSQERGFLFSIGFQTRQ
ncbi:MAG: outer membrane protein transport protein [Blastocatellia bacterium]|nr:outer membrane protein transport protein [Blastocatellia bacterium]